MYENKIVFRLKNGEVTKEELDQCSTCDMDVCANNGLSEKSIQHLKNRTVVEIVNADIV